MVRYPSNVRQIISRLKSPAQVQGWLYTLQYNTAETMRTLPGVVRAGRAHCLEAVLAAATILEQHGYPPLVLDLESADRLGHDLFLYQREGKFGTVGWSRDVGLNGRKPVYKTIRQLVQSYAAPYIDERARITSYAVYDLRQLRRTNWRSAAGNVWSVEKALRDAPHTRFKLSKTYVARWRNKHRLFKQRHPGKQPNIYRHTRYWV